MLSLTQDNVCNKVFKHINIYTKIYELGEGCISCEYGCRYWDQHPFKGYRKVVEAAFNS